MKNWPHPQKTWLWGALGLTTALMGLGLLPLPARANPYFSCEAGQQCLSIIGFNDVYRVEPTADGKFPGLARLATVLAQLRAENPGSLVLFAGDTLSPSAESKALQGQQMIAAWNQLGVDGATLGNHEFDFGPEVLAQRLNESQFPWLAANVRVQPGFALTQTAIKPYSIKQVNGLKVAIFGLLTPETLYSSNVQNSVMIDDPLETAQKLVPRLQKTEHPDLIIALTHLNLKDDKRLAQTVPGIDLILGGHDHDRIEQWVQNTQTRRLVPVFKWDSDVRTVGHLQLNVGQQKRLFKTPKPFVKEVQVEILPILASTVAQPNFTRGLGPAYQAYQQQQTGQASVLATFNTPLDTLQAHVREQETNAGSLVADAYRWLHQSQIGLTNGGSIRSNRVFAPGPFTTANANEILPFGNRIVKVSVPGRVIKAMLEQSYSQLNRLVQPGGFLQVSGLKITADLAQTPVLQSVLLEDGTPLEPETLYSVALPDYLAKGGNDYLGLKAYLQESGQLCLLDDLYQQTEAEALSAYLLSRKPTSLSSPLSLPALGRVELKHLPR